METVDDEILQNTFAFIDKAKRDNKPFFVWLNPDAHARRDPPVGEIPEHAQLRQWLVDFRGRHSPNSTISSAPS